MEIELKAWIEEPIDDAAVAAAAATWAPERRAGSDLLARYCVDGLPPRVSLRARRDGDTWTATAKAPRGSVGAAHARLEIDAPLDGPPRAGDPLPASLAAVVQRGDWPETGFEVRVRRARWIVHHGDATVELVRDLGSVEARGRRLTVDEVELERVDGDPAALLPIALTLAARLPVRPGGWSKAARGLALLDRLPPPPPGGLGALLDRLDRLDAGMPVGDLDTAAAACGPGFPPPGAARRAWLWEALARTA